mgnify:CR=1 FL=1
MSTFQQMWISKGEYDDQKRQAEHLHRGLAELDVNSLAMILVQHSGSTGNEIHFEAYEYTIHTSFDVIDW